MKLDDLLLSKKEFSLIDVITEQCSQFIYQSKGYSLLKNLPEKYNDFRRVKVRKRKGDAVSPQFNEAFDYHQLRQRAVFANGERSLEESKGGFEPFYIFPINGYKYLYSKKVQNSNLDYKKSFNSILETMGNKKGASVINDMLQFSYIDNEKLSEGIESGAEIIIYNIPYFYGLRASSINKYKNFYKIINTQ